MVVWSLILAILSFFTALAAAIYARRSANASVRSAEAADKAAAAAARAAAAEEQSAAVEADRRLEELTPKFEITAQPANPGSEQVTMTLTLRGPVALGSLSQISLNIEDEHPWRAGANPLPGGPTREELAEQIWGPYRFVPGTGPGANSLAGVLGASRSGRDITVSRQLKIGDPIPFALEPTRPGRWMTGTTQQDWQRERGRVVRLTAACISGDGRKWFVPLEVTVSTSAPEGADPA